MAAARNTVGKTESYLYKQAQNKSLSQMSYFASIQNDSRKLRGFWAACQSTQKLIFA